MAVPEVIECYLSLTFLIPSILSALFCLYHLLRSRALRTSLNNHVVIIIILLDLIYNVTVAVWFIHYFRTGVSLSPTQGFCLTWAYLGLAVLVSLTYVVAWASIERHVLIFHQNLVSTPMKRFLFHYLPLFVSTMYPFLYYVIIFFVRPCQATLVASIPFCGLDYCAYDDAGIGLWDGIANNIVPVFSIVLFSIALLGRVWYSKYRINQRMRWRKYRKMAVQLLSISAIYLICLFPATVLYTAYMAGVPTTFAEDVYPAILYMGFFAVYLTPFVSMFSLPELRAKLWNVFSACRPRRHAVHPFTMGMTRFAGNTTMRVQERPLTNRL